MSKIIDFQEWVKKDKQSEFDIRINKPFNDLTDSEIRILLEQMVLRQNALISKLISFGKLLGETGETQNTINDRFNKKQSDLIDSHNELIEEVNNLINKR